jgi:hypothetical protein
MRHSLCRSHVFLVAVHYRLYYNDPPYSDDVATHQTLVLGACLQLSMNGSYFCSAKGLDERQSALRGSKMLVLWNILVDNNFWRSVTDLIIL